MRNLTNTVNVTIVIVLLVGFAFELIFFLPLRSYSYYSYLGSAGRLMPRTKDNAPYSHSNQSHSERKVT
jgi:hypothetical protein